MQVSLSWLKDYIPIEMDTAVLAQALTMVGFEVESVSNRYAYLDLVYVARIVEVIAHPNAEALKICRVDTGTDILSVVCGAPNAEKGTLAPLALPGTVFPEGWVLAKSVIRGQTSEGMLCSQAELGLGPDKAGIMVLDPSFKTGVKLTDALGIADTVLEFDITPNRPDCLSVIGIGREIAAIQKTPLNYPDYRLTDNKNTISRFTSVTIKAPDQCPRYAARLLVDIKVKPSPFWLQDRLLSVGLRPINNVVDVTNFVLMETGQPLHAFDFDRLAENRIVVRTAEPGETFVTLDQKERSLDAEMLMICDGKKPVAIGGVMGGLNSEIDSKTTRVLIESAYFNPASIRRTSKQLGLGTEASYRFERGVDPQGTLAALNRAARLMAEVGAGKIIDGLIDEHPKPQPTRRLTLSTRHTNRLLGTRLKRSEIEDLLQLIEFKLKPESNGGDDDRLSVEPPSFRVDISRPEDLMEEVARLFGYNNIPTTFPLIPVGARQPAKRITLRNRTRQLMTGFGFTEVITYSFAHQLSCDRLRLNPDDERRSLIHILNPLTEDQAVMRSSLIPGLLQGVYYNVARQVKSQKLFEIGKIFISNGPDILPREIEMLIGLWTGARVEASWHVRETLCDFYDIKGAAEGLLNALKIEPIRFTRLPDESCTYTRAGYSAQILADRVSVGLVGEIHPQVLADFNLKQSAYIFEIDMDRLLPLIGEAQFSKPIPKFPAVFRDITIHVNKDIETLEILESAQNFGEALVERLQLLGVFEGHPIPAGQKSVSIRITYRSASKTLEDQDIYGLHKSIADRLVKAFDAILPA